MDRTTTVLSISAGAAITGLLAYAVYFDHRRRTDAEFRKSLKRESKRQEKAHKAEQEASAQSKRREIMALVRDMNAEGFPTDADTRERLFLESMTLGEQYAATGQNMDAAANLFKCLKMYPAKAELIKLFDTTVPKDVLDILAVMIATDPDLSAEDALDDIS
ncbi:mitochondrial import receptor subunit [Microthyrium microscopicum]|uniref:Mitochondrial import receptor subunit n=1 Tax=Microthyrium microscopicum TaxID=703497 RepID=A0A6A6UK49_9PEZI|nr:mitochondrial import receptor subunit [Microthyrium microscopicum]